MEAKKRPSPQEILTQLSQAGNAAAFNAPREFNFSHLPDYRAMMAVNALVVAGRAANFDSYPEIVIYTAEQLEVAQLQLNASNPKS